MIVSSSGLDGSLYLVLTVVLFDVKYEPKLTLASALYYCKVDVPAAPLLILLTITFLAAFSFFVLWFFSFVYPLYY